MSRASALLLAFLGAFGPSSPALAQQTVNIPPSVTVGYNVCGNGAGGNGPGDCGVDVSGDPDNFDETATTGNTVSVTNDASVDHAVHGAFNIGNGVRAVEGNQVTIDTTGNIQGDVTGGRVNSDDADTSAKDNRVVFNTGNVTNGSLYGGHASSSGAGNASAKDNRVVFVDGTVSYSLYGGNASNNGGSGIGHADHNTLEMSGGTVFEAYGGHVNSTNIHARATRNSFTLSGGAQVDWNAYGGRAESSAGGKTTAEENTLSISGSAQVGGNAYGANAGGGGASDALVKDNHLTLSGSAAIDRDAYGANAVGEVNATATENTITISGGSVGGGSWQVNGVAGGAAYATKAMANVVATKNHAVISGGTVGDPQAHANVYGGHALSLEPGTTPTVTLNTVTLSGSAQVEGNAFGGTALARASGWLPSDRNDAVATKNTITVSGGNVTGMTGVAGGQAVSIAGDATATDNRAFISGNAAIGVVYGAYANGGDKATTGDNRIEMSGGSVSGSLYGGWSQNDQGLALARANTIRLSGGTANEVHGGHVQSTNGAAEASKNEVEISGAATVKSDVYGAYVEGQSATATGNIVTISGGTVESNGGIGIAGAYAHAKDAQYDAVASANTITVSGGLVDHSLMGGFAEGAGAARSQGNIVTISGGEVRGDIFGGAADSRGRLDAFATHNVVTLSGTPTLDSAGLYGGIAAGGAGSDAFTGNTLNLKTSGLTVASLQHFEFLNFHLPSTLGKGQTMLTVTGTADLTDGGSRSATVSLAIDGASSALQPGDHVILIDAGAGTLIGDPANTQATAKGTHGATLTYDFSLTTSARQLIATLDKSRVREETKSLSEGYLSGMALLAQGSGFLARQGIDAARDALRDNEAHRPRTFATLSGSAIRYETGSHVDVKGYTLVTGMAQGFRTGAGDATLAGFFEYGRGDYTSHNSFASGKVKGEGDTAYKGIGLLGRFDFRNAAYIEGSVRGGRTDTNYRSNELRDALGQRVRYDTRNGYLGVHLGAGREWALNEKITLDAYAQALLTHQEKDAVRLSTGERVKFDAINSERLKTGVRLKRAFSSRLSGYAGLAYDHEFSGKARATTGGQKIDAPSLTGGAGVFELGLSGRPRPGHPLRLDFSIQAYTGKREGATGNMRANYSF
jgi:hypothetical protein